MDTAVIFDIQRFSLHDGPGIRTTVFFKGCSLACRWCQNPESLSMSPEMAYYGEHCRQCLACREVCPNSAIVEGEDQRIDFQKCDACGLCVEQCTTNSLRLIGENWEAEALARELAKDIDFFEDSGGGVTLSGGEPLLQAGFLTHLLPRLKEMGIHINLETAGMYSFDRLVDLLEHLDLIYYDLKHMDSEAHQKATGRPNDRILDNFVRLSRADIELQARIPVIPGINDDHANLRAIAGFLSDLGHDSIHCLGYHRMGESKLPRIKSALNPLGLNSQSREDMAVVVDVFGQEDINAVLYD